MGYVLDDRHQVYGRKSVSPIPKRDLYGDGLARQQPQPQLTSARPTYDPYDNIRGGTGYNFEFERQQQQPMLPQQQQWQSYGYQQQQHMMRPPQHTVRILREFCLISNFRNLLEIQEPLDPFQISDFNQHFKNFFISICFGSADLQ